MSTKRSIDNIDERAVIDYIVENRSRHSFPDDFTTQSEQRTANEETVQTAPTATSEQAVQPETKRVGSKQRKASLEEFRLQFMQTPRIDDRKPVFISLVTRDSLDRIVRLFGERGLSVSGLVENLAQNFLETYREDIEQWRKL